MLPLSSLPRQFLDFLSVLLDKLSRPDLNSYQGKIEQKIAYIRNKFLLMFQLLLIIVHCADISLNTYSLGSAIIRTALTSAICIIFTITCRSKPQLFNISCSLICLIYGPSRLQVAGEGIFKAWVSTSALPSLVYVFTGSFSHFIFQVCAQMLYVNFIYKHVLECTLITVSPESFIKSSTTATNIVIIMSSGLVVVMHFFMKSAYSELTVAEKRKDEIENQKTSLLTFSHEIRNLINSITGNVKLAGLENLTQRSKELLLNAEVCGELLLHLVNNILDGGKDEIGELEINPTPTKVYDTLHRVWGVCAELIKRKQLSGKMEVPKNLPKILNIDHYRLTQIFLNLVGNAVKFTDTGSVNISIEWMIHTESAEENIFKPYPLDEHDEFDEGLFQKQKIFSIFDSNVSILRLSSQSFDKYSIQRTENTPSEGILKVSINDTGCGMSSEETSRLFHKYTQVTSDASKKKLGTGLGLYITKQLCQKMNGDVKVFSRKGVGSAFIFYVPVTGSKAETERVRQS